jgi:amino acid transporter
MHLKRSIGTFSLLLGALGGIVGSGWLLGPFFAAKCAGPAAILAWVLGGCMMMIIALTFAELTSSFPFTGGAVRFLQLSHGPLVNFAMSWIGWLASVAVAPIETMALLNYAAIYLPFLMHQVNGVNLLTGTGVLVAGILLFILCVLNSVGVKFLAKTNSAVVILKLAVPIMTLFILFAFAFHPHNLTASGFAPLGIKGMLAALPSAGVIFSFIGYSSAIQLAGETKNPQRSIPIAIIGSLGICIVLYVLLQLAFIGALAPSAFAHGWGHLNFTGDAGPFAGIAVAIGLAWLAKILFIDAAISPYGTALIYTAGSARMCYALGQAGFLPPGLMKINRHGIPTRIVALNFVIGLFLFLPFPTWQNMMSFLVSSFVFAYAVGPLSLIVLRKTLPTHPRPFRVPAVRIFCLLAFYLCNLIIYWTGWPIVSKMLIFILLGYIVLAIYKKTKQGRLLNLQWNKSWWMFFYIAIMGMVTYLGSFGGKNIITFGWDFLVLALISWLVFELSIRCALEAEETHKQIQNAVELSHS